ncbi:hypothetical protein VSU01S_25880 [Vibrio superstes NBRC 103154]|uniref:Uncharacterized protein n=1 Tax=Vibrio superstes NBRC 103154 TaxID=1219062 RepID=A0A511QSL1_9VIBR|nr:hypothetical protein VSU01S_25880 [Vibrio superstes NBRC 103154]
MFIYGVRADDTIARIVSKIEPKPFHECVINWMSSIHVQVVAIDGKTLRGSYDR